MFLAPCTVKGECWNNFGLFGFDRAWRHIGKDNIDGKGTRRINVGLIGIIDDTL